MQQDGLAGWECPLERVRQTQAVLLTVVGRAAVFDAVHRD